MKRLLNTLVFIPLAIELFLLFTLYNKVGGAIWSIHVPIIILLILISISIINNKKAIQWVGTVALILLTILLSIMGYYDYIQWFSTIVGIILFIYFLVIGVAIRKLRKSQI